MTPDPHEPLEPIDEDEPIPGTLRSRVALVAGLAIAALIIGFLAWFIATHADRGQSGGLIG
jgi:hypothetical protein